MADQTEVKMRESLEAVAWSEKHTMAAIRATASYGEVVLTTEHGPYDIDRPTFKCDRLVEAIVAARDVHWQSALKARDAEIERLRGDAERYQWLREQEWYESNLCVLRDPKRVLTQGIGLGADCPSHDRLDAAIDQARAEGGEKK